MLLCMQLIRCMGCISRWWTSWNVAAMWRIKVAPSEDRLSVTRSKRKLAIASLDLILHPWSIFATSTTKLTPSLPLRARVEDGINLSAQTGIESAQNGRLTALQASPRDSKRDLGVFTVPWPTRRPPTFFDTSRHEPTLLSVPKAAPR